MRVSWSTRAVERETERQTEREKEKVREKENTISNDKFKSPSVKYSILGQLTFYDFLFNSDLYSNRIGIHRRL